MFLDEHRFLGILFAWEFYDNVQMLFLTLIDHRLSDIMTFAQQAPSARE